MYFCYVDEAGCTGNLASSPTKIQPVFVLCGLIIPADQVTSLTHGFLQLKRNFSPKLSSSLKHDLDIITYEIKGAEDLRKPIRKKNRNARRRALGFIDKTFQLLEQHQCRIIPNIYIKDPNTYVSPLSLYTRSVQSLSKHFQRYLEANSSNGIIIADSRNHALNVQVAHSIFTQKFKATGDLYPNVLEMPLFGHSDNHSALQITDILCSSLLFPIATYVYCSDLIHNIHIHPRYAVLQSRYAYQLKNISFRYNDNGYFHGGITVKDSLGNKSASAFLNLPAQ